MTERYTVAIMMNEAGTEIVAMHKLRPTEYNGFLNGPGGRVDPGETYIDGLCREVEEETGVIQSPLQWSFVGYWQTNNHALIAVYAGFDDVFMQSQTKTDEAVIIQSVPELLARDDLMPNYATMITKSLEQRVYFQNKIPKVTP